MFWCIVNLGPIPPQRPPGTPGAPKGGMSPQDISAPSPHKIPIAAIPLVPGATQRRRTPSLFLGHQNSYLLPHFLGDFFPGQDFLGIQAMIPIFSTVPGVVARGVDTPNDLPRFFVVMVFGGGVVLDPPSAGLAVVRGGMDKDGGADAFNTEKFPFFVHTIGEGTG